MRRATLHRAGRVRFSSTAAAVETKPRRLPKFLGAVGCTGAGAAAFVTTERFAHERPFRLYMRAEYPWLTEWIEGTVLVDYAPSAWSKHVRIVDDACVSDEAPSAPPPSALRSVLPNVGGASLTPPPMGEVGLRVYGRLAGIITTPPPGAAAASDTRDSVPGDSSSAPGGAAAGVNLFTAPGASSLPPIAPDEAEAEAEAEVKAPGADAQGEHAPVPPTASETKEHAVSLASRVTALEAVAAASRELEEAGGPDGARWGAASEEVLLRAWSTAAPPELASRLLVSQQAAARFEAAIAAFHATCDAHAALATMPDSQRLDAEAEAKAVAAAASAASTAAAAASRVQPAPGGRRLIALPGALRDGAFGDGAVEAPVPPAAQMQWLRVREAYAAAEAETIDADYRLVGRVVRRGEGGGVAMQRMIERRRQLTYALNEYDHEKRVHKLSQQP